MNDKTPKSPSELSDSQKLTPSATCIFCNKKLEDVGGKRIIAQKFIGVVLSAKYQGGGNKDYPRKSVKLNDKLEYYVVTWDEKCRWTQSLIEKARNEFFTGYHPWFCQICGARTCSKCGSPINYPMGSDILYDNGCSGHCGILPFNPGCNNPDCANYREWKI